MTPSSLTPCLSDIYDRTPSKQLIYMASGRIERFAKKTRPAFLRVIYMYSIFQWVSLLSVDQHSVIKASDGGVNLRRMSVHGGHHLHLVTVFINSISLCIEWPPLPTKHTYIMYAPTKHHWLFFQIYTYIQGSGPKNIQSKIISIHVITYTMCWEILDAEIGAC